MAASSLGVQSRLPSRRRAVLVVDDDEWSRRTLADWLQRAGWAVVVAHRYADALREVETSRFEHVLVEQELSDGSGLDLFVRLRARAAVVSGVLLTRQASLAGAVRAMRGGFRDYLSKPLEARQLTQLFGQEPAGRDRTPFGGADQRYSLGRVQQEHIAAVLVECEGNVSEAARWLGLHRRSLQRKLQRQSVDVALGSRRDPA